MNRINIIKNNRQKAIASVILKLEEKNSKKKER